MAMTLGEPRVSIIVPLFNCLALTRAMLASLERSMPQGLRYEVILIDDGSTDGTREWLEGVAGRYRVVLNKENLGYAGATNRGASLAQGEILALLNNDLVLRHGWLPPMLTALRTLGGRAGIVGNVQTNAATGKVDHSGIRINLKGKPEHDRRRHLFAALLWRIRPVPALTGACVLVNRKTWVELGGFDTRFFNGCEDVDLCLRARSAGLINAVALTSVVAHHVSASPGRKAHDEQNTQLLVQRWRAELARLGGRAWTRRYFADVLRDPRDFADPREAWRMAFFASGTTRNAPDTSRLGIEDAIEQELVRWDKMISN